MAITYVGGTSGVGTGASYNVSLTSLSGGSDSAPSEGDLILVFTGESNGGTVTSACSGNNSGSYSTTIAAHLVRADTYDANLDSRRKFAGATPDTSLTITRGANNTTYGSATVVHVWRGVDPDTPLDVTPTTATRANSSVANPPAITPSTAGAMIVYCGHSTQTSTGTAFTNAGGSYTVSAKGNGSTSDSNVAVEAYTSWTSGSYNPASFSGSTTTTAGAWCAITLALRPAPEPGTNWDGGVDETSGTSDALAGGMLANVAASEAVGASDEASAVVTYAATAVDSAETSDGCASYLVPSESALRARSGAWNARAYNTHAYNGAYDGSQNLLATAADAASIADVPTGSVFGVVAAVESSSPADVPVAIVVLGAGVAEAMVASTVQAAQSLATAGCADAIAPHDAIAASAFHSGIAAENLTTADASAALAANTAAATESATPEGTAVAAQVLNAEVGDGATATDAPFGAMTLPAAAADLLTAGDAIVAAGLYAGATAETAATGDAALGGTVWYADCAEAAAAMEAMFGGMLVDAGANDTATVDESMAGSHGRYAGSDESAAPTDAAACVAGWAAFTTEQVASGDFLRAVWQTKWAALTETNADSGLGKTAGAAVLVPHAGRSGLSRTSATAALTPTHDSGGLH